MKNPLRGLLAAPLATLAILAVLFTGPMAAMAQTPSQTPLDLTASGGATVPECAYTVGGSIATCHVIKVWNGSAWIDLVVDPATGAVLAKTTNGALDTTLQAQQANPGSDATKPVGVQGCTSCKPVSVSTSYGNLTAAPVSVGTGATLLASARTGRGLVMIINESTTVARFGGASVTGTTGAILPGVVGASITIPFSGALYGAVASGTATVSVVELF